jgi:hypothetical protein
LPGTCSVRGCSKEKRRHRCRGATWPGVGASRHGPAYYEAAYGVHWPVQHAGASSTLAGRSGHLCLRLTADQQYSASSAYGAMFVGCSRPLGAWQLWKISAPPRVKLFFWLVMHGRCWTTHRRWRHGLQESSSCIICDQAEETMDHIILGCVFSREVWSSCLKGFPLQDLVLIQEGDIMLWWTDSRRRLPKPIRRGFDSLFFLVRWTLWKERNAE